MDTVTRRAFVAGSVAAAVALAVPRRGFASAEEAYRRAIVIDGLGGLGNSLAEEGKPLADRYIEDARASGVTRNRNCPRAVSSTRRCTMASSMSRICSSCPCRSG